MASLTSALRRLARLESAQSQPRDAGTCQAPPLPPEQLRVVLRMLIEAGGLCGERFAEVRAALAAAQQEAVGAVGGVGEEGGDEDVDEERR